MRLLLDLPLEGGYFRPLADQPTMAQALWTTVRELRMAGVRAGQMPSLRPAQVAGPVTCDAAPAVSPSQGAPEWPFGANGGLLPT